MKGEECYTCSRRRSPCPPRGRRRERGVQGRSQTLFAPRPATPQRSIQGRFRANCSALESALTSTLAERTRCTTALILCLVPRPPSPVLRDDRTSRCSPSRDPETAAAPVEPGGASAMREPGCLVDGPLLSNTPLMGREKSANNLLGRSLHLFCCLN